MDPCSSKTALNHTDNSVQNALELHATSQMILEEGRSLRPKSTDKNYKNYQDEYLHWCFNLKKFSDGASVSDAKLASFLKLYVHGEDSDEAMRRVNVLESRQSNQSSDGVFKRKYKSKKTVWSRELYLGFTKAIVSLYNQQVTLKTNLNPPPRGILTKTFLDTLVRKSTQRKRENFEDRGKNVLNDAYTKKEMINVSKCFLNNANPGSTRNRLIFLMSHSMLLRSQNATGMQLADLFCMEIEDQGLSKCIAVVATIDWGKTNNAGKTEYGSCIRHKNTEVCSVNAFAMYFFSLYHSQCLSFPNLAARKEWYDTYLFPANNKYGHFLYEDQCNAYKGVFKACNIQTSKITHSNRKSGIQFIVNKGVPSDQLRQVGRWSSDRMVSCYLVCLPVKALKALADFSAEREGDYFISRANIEPPHALQNKVFPQIETWKDRFQNKDNIEEDLAARNFLELLEYLRIVFLQDSVVLKQKYPDHYLWKNEIFDSPEYLLFEQQLSTVINRNEAQINMAQHLDVLVPELTSAMREGFEALNTSVAAIQAQNATIQVQNQDFYKKYEDSERATRDLLAHNLRQAANIIQGSSTLALSPPPLHRNSGSLSNEVTIVESSVNILEQPEETSMSLNPPVSLNPLVSLNPSVSLNPPEYRMNRDIYNVLDVWREYTIGIQGGPAVEYLENNFQTRWRQNRTESRYFSSRSVIYNEIKMISRRDNISNEEAAKILEERRQEHKFTLYKLTKSIIENNKNANMSSS